MWATSVASGRRCFHSYFMGLRRSHARYSVHYNRGAYGVFVLRATLTFDITNHLYPLQERSFNTKIDMSERTYGPTAMRRRKFFPDMALGQLAHGKQKIGASAPQNAPPAPPNHDGKLRHRQASIARKNRRLLTLPDGAVNRRQ